MSQDISTYKQYNPARNGTYIFTVTSSRNISFKLQNAVVPGVMLGGTPFQTQKMDIIIPSNKIDFSGPLPLRMLISEDLTEWVDVYRWMVQLTKANDIGGDSAELTILNSQNVPVMRFLFTGVWPLTLGDLQYTVVGDETVLSCDVSFNFDTFILENLKTGERIGHAE